MGIPQLLGGLFPGTSENKFDDLGVLPPFYGNHHIWQFFQFGELFVYSQHYYIFVFQYHHDLLRINMLSIYIYISLYI
jgi:hypothetical protein